jgi:hypothetical protein
MRSTEKASGIPKNAHAKCKLRSGNRNSKTIPAARAKGAISRPPKSIQAEPAPETGRKPKENGEAANRQDFKGCQLGLGSL